MHSSHIRPLLTLALIAFASPTLADIAPPPFPSASSPQPMEATQAQGISMKREEVTLELFDLYAIVDATFLMRNAEKARTLEVGFPGAGIPTRQGVHSELVGFTAWVNGKKVAAEERTTESCEGGCKYGIPRRETWHVFSVPFSPGETKVRVRYRVETAPTGLVDVEHAPNCESWQTAWYILATGRRWSGTIGEAVIRIIARRGVDPRAVVVLDGHMKSTGQAVRNAQGLMIQRQQLEPTLDDDLEILYCATPPRQPEAAPRP
jgi:hypothetical protein